MKSKGLGDSIEKFTTFTGIKRVVEAVNVLAGIKGCGCDERKQFLNELFPYESSKRKFKFLKDFVYGGVNYESGEEINVGKDHDLYDVIINLVRDKILKEL